MKSKILYTLLFFFISTSVSAQELSLGIGQWQIFDEGGITAVRVGYELKQRDRFFKIKPNILVIADDSDRYYVSGGITRDFPINDKWLIGTGLNGGLLEGDPDLGHTIQFYSRINLAYKLSARDVIFIELGHISNASLGDENPGSELLSINYKIKL